MLNRLLLYILTGLLIAGGITSCSRRPIIHHYEQVPLNGWTPGDTIKFRIDSVKTGGNYLPVIGIRTSATVPFPYRSLWLAVHQQWYAPDSSRTDTLKCVLTDDNGDIIGHGVSIYQYTFSLSPRYLNAGSSADISVSHIMRNDILPGITEIGLLIKPQD